MPDYTPEDDMAITAFNFLANGSGGVDWAGFELVVGMLGIEDIEGLVHRLLIIKTHKPPDDSEPEAPQPSHEDS